MLSRLDALVEEKSQVKVYDLVDITKILKISKRTVFTWLKQGILPHSKVAGKIWISEEQLRLFLQKHSNESNGLEINRGEGGNYAG